MHKWLHSVLATLFTIGVCYAAGVVFTFTSFAFSWFLNFILMAWYTYVASQLEPKLSSSYFKPKAFEKEGQIYKHLGVHVYRKLLVLIGWERISRKNNSIRNSLSALKVCEYNTRSSELGHTVIAIIVFLTATAVAASWKEAKWFIFTNIVLNIYPVLVQRFNRPRYRTIIEKRTAEERQPQV